MQRAALWSVACSVLCAVAGCGGGAATTVEEVPPELVPWRDHMAAAEEAFTTGDKAEAERRLDEARKEAESVAPNGRELAASLASLGSIKEGAGKLDEALDLYAKALAAWEKSSEADDAAVAVLAESVARIHITRQELDRAEPYVKRALVVRQASPGATPELALDLTILGEIQRSRGAADAARSLYERADATWTALATPDEPERAATLGGLAAIQSAAGDLARAEANFLEAARVLEKAFGAEDPRVVYALDNLVEHYRAVGRPAKAYELAKRSLAIATAAGSPDDERFGRLQAVVMLATEAGVSDEAATIVERALEAERARAEARDDRRVAALLATLAEVRRSQERADDVVKLYGEALALMESKAGDDDLDLASILNNFAAALASRGETDRAVQLFDRARSIFERSLGAADERVVSITDNLVELYVGAGRAADADRLARETLERRAAALGETHAATLAAVEGLARVKAAAGDLEGAEPLYRRLLAAREAAGAGASPEAAVALTSLAELLRARGKTDEIEGLYTRAIAAWTASAGADDPNVASALNNLALLYTERGEHERAESHARRAVAILERALRPDDPYLATALMNHAHVLRALGRTADAEALERRAEPVLKKADGKNPE